MTSQDRIAIAVLLHKLTHGTPEERHRALRTASINHLAAALELAESDLTIASERAASDIREKLEEKQS